MDFLKDVKKGAQIIAHKIEQKGKAWWEEQKRIGELQRRAQAAEQQAYEKSLITQAKKRGAARAKKAPKSNADSIVDILLGSSEKEED